MHTEQRPLTKREKAKAKTTERALEAAKALWSEPGSYNKNGIREIAKHMGMSTGALFANFTGKDDLWRSAFGTEPPVDSELTRDALKFYAEKQKEKAK